MPSGIKLTYEFVKPQFETAGYTFLEEIYIDSKTKMKYRCPNGHEHSMSWDKWKQGVRCPHCSGVAKHTHKLVKERIESEGYILTSEEYINAHTRLDYICPNGHKHSTTWANWSQGRRCGRCKGNIEIKHEDVKDFIEKEYYILISDKYISSDKHLITLCPNKHEYKISWSNWKQGYRCPKCTNVGTSNFEKEVKQFIIDQGINIIENDRTTILNPKTNRYLELDILLTCKTKAIECNDNYWHARPEIKEKDVFKLKQCKKLGLKLLVVEFDLWYKDKEKCENIIKDFINE